MVKSRRPCPHMIIGTFTSLEITTSVAMRIDLITVLEAILTGRQTRLEIQCLYGNAMSNNLHKTSLLKKS